MSILRVLATLAITFCLLAVFSFTFKAEVERVQDSENALFTCNFNGKDIFVKGLKAEYRTITGGYKQLSLSNDKFSSFVFIDPSEKKITLSPSSNREAFVRYKEPGTDKIFKPAEGHIQITHLDLEKKIVSGSFEMVLTTKDGNKIKVTSGKFLNIPIVDKAGY